MKDCRYYDMCFRCGDECDGEPECPHRRTCPFYSPMPDRDSLLALADEIEDYADGGGARFGRVIDRGRAKGYSRRIREALGVRDA